MYLSAPQNMSQKELDAALDFAAEMVDDQSVPWLVAAGASVDQADSWGRTFLHRTSMKGHCAFALALVRAGASTSAVDKSRMTPLQYAWFYAHDELALALMDADQVDLQLRNSDGQTYLHWAASSTQLRKSTAILAFINHNVALEAVDNAGETALTLSASYLIPSVQTLIDCGSSLHAANFAGLTALHKAASSYSESHSAVLTRMLIHAGAPLDAVDENGMTSLHMACVRMNFETAKLLLSAGADPYRIAHRRLGEHSVRERVSLVDCLSIEERIHTEPDMGPGQAGFLALRAFCLLLAAYGVDTSKLPAGLGCNSPLLGATLLGLTPRVRQLLKAGSSATPLVNEPGEKDEPKDRLLSDIALQAGHQETAGVLKAAEAQDAIEEMMACNHKPQTRKPISKASP